MLNAQLLLAVISPTQLRSQERERKNGKKRAQKTVPRV